VSLPPPKGPTLAEDAPADFIAALPSERRDVVERYTRLRYEALRSTLVARRFARAHDIDGQEWQAAELVALEKRIEDQKAGR
jgi:hypothetical protein